VNLRADEEGGELLLKRPSTDLQQPLGFFATVIGPKASSASILTTIPNRRVFDRKASSVNVVLVG